MVPSVKRLKMKTEMVMLVNVLICMRVTVSTARRLMVVGTVRSVISPVVPLTE
jgi:hypothetical protein